jgi:hypothetical protein
MPADRGILEHVQRRPLEPAGGISAILVSEKAAALAKPDQVAHKPNISA